MLRPASYKECDPPPPSTYARSLSHTLLSKGSRAVSLLRSCLCALALEAEVRDDGRIGPKVGRDEERDVAHVLHLRKLGWVVNLKYVSRIRAR